MVVQLAKSESVNFVCAKDDIFVTCETLIRHEFTPSFDASGLAHASSMPVSALQTSLTLFYHIIPIRESESASANSQNALRMSILFSDFHEAQRAGAGPLLASCLAPINSESDPKRLWSFSQLSNHQTVEADIRYHVIQDRNAVKLSKAEANQWVQIFIHLWRCIRELALIEAGRGGDWNAAFKAYKDLCINLGRGYTNYGFQAWTIPCMYTAGKYLRIIAARADANAAADRSATNNGFTNGLSDDITDTNEKNDKLQDAARTLQQMLSICRTDDSDLATSRKWGVLGIANLLFKTYFQLGNLSLTKHVILMLNSTELPDLSLFPKSTRCTYTYYRGIIEFLKENYTDAESYLSQSLSICHKSATRNREQILTYLIPAHILTTHQLPSATLLSQSPTLKSLFSPICTAIKQGNLSAFDAALSTAELDLVHRRIYLTLERSRDICMRNLFRKVFMAAGYEDAKEPNAVQKVRRTRLNISEFEAAIRVASRGAEDPMEVVEKDEVECFLANMIYKGFMKGYIAREQGKVVLSKRNDAFPGTGV